MGPNIWSALRMQSEFLEYTSNIQECTTNFHSDGIRDHSASRVTGVLHSKLFSLFFFFIGCVVDVPNKEYYGVIASKED